MRKLRLPHDAGGAPVPKLCEALPADNPAAGCRQLRSVSIEGELANTGLAERHKRRTIGTPPYVDAVVGRREARPVGTECDALDPFSMLHTKQLLRQNIEGVAQGKNRLAVCHAVPTVQGQ